MKRVYLLGDPVSHSISPAMQNAAFAAVGLDWQYELMPVSRENLPGAIERLRREDCAGANVTIPHKQAVVELLDEVSPAVRQMGAANTITHRGGELIGENTDGYGFTAALRQAGFELRAKRIAILGAGGVARAAAFAAAEGGAARMAIVNRTPEHAETLAALVRSEFPRLPVVVNDAAALADADLVVNATSVGMHPRVDETPLPGRLAPGAVAYDLVYRPAQTRFMREAEQAGAKTIGGLGMLVYQGAASFESWTGLDAPIDVMFAAARQALDGV